MYNQKPNFLPLIICLGLLSAHCGDGDSPTDAGTSPDAGKQCIEANFTSIHDGLLATPSCTGSICHSTSGNAGNLILDTGKDSVYQALIGPTDAADAVAKFPKLVVASTSSTSFLWNKVSEQFPESGSRMPVSPTPLEPCELDAIKRWIDSGAANN